MMIEWIISFILGFVTFFATGIDDTLVYAGSYLHNHKRKVHKNMISIGIMIGTFIALGIAIYASSLMNLIPFKSLIGGGILILLGVIMFLHKPRTWHKKKIKFFGFEKYLKKYIKNHKLKKNLKHIRYMKFIGLGILLFFSTGIDDLIAYSNLIMAKGAWLPICTGVIAGTIVSLIAANLLSYKLKRFAHPERIGGTIIIIIGILLASGIL